LKDVEEDDRVDDEKGEGEGDEEEDEDETEEVDTSDEEICG
jgi:hypothetical protein